MGQTNASPNHKNTAQSSYIRRWTWTTLLEYEVQNGNEKGSSLSRAGLSTGHEVPLGENDGQGMLLHWGGLGVMCQLEW